MQRLHVDEMLSEMTASEFAEWDIALSLGASDTSRDADLRAGIISSVIANVYRDRKARAAPFQPSDFMPQRIPKRKPTKAELRAKAQYFGIAHGPKKRKGAKQ